MNHLTGLRFHQKLYVLGRKSKYYPISTFARHNNKKKTIVRSFQFWFRNFRIHEPNKVQSWDLSRSICVKSSLDAQWVAQSIEYEETEFVNVYSYFEQYILLSNEATLKTFLTFVTGSPVLPKFGFGKTNVEVDKSMQSIISSTCFNSLSVPATSANQEQFNESLNVVITRKTFSSI